jgi:hypothetical protein
MSHPLPPPDRHPAGHAADHWTRLRDAVPAALFDAASWDRLAGVAPPLLPGPAFLLERTLDSPRIIQFGAHVWPWRMDGVRSAVLSDHVRAWRAADRAADGTDRPYLHLMAMWDEPLDGAPPAPQVFLAFFPDTPGWRPAVHAFADRLDDAAIAEAWHGCADTPHAGVVALGIYRGPRSVPARVTVTTRGPRQWPGHPNWPAVERIAALVDVHPAIAVAPGADPGPVWHVPAITSRHPRPHEALAPLVDALRRRGLVDADTAATLLRPPLMIPVPEPALLDGQPALLRLMVSLERIKVVVEDGAWRSAKACYMVRPVWRTGAGRVWVED